ncbi:MAG: hypothetical protein Q4D42_01465 [Eubacteriales bacterium]|nr:hypothetical protein [Eubacteriales bacterium]
MKRNKWDRRDYKIAGCVIIVVCIAFVALTIPIGIPGAIRLIGMWLWILIATGFFVGWALKNESRWSAFWQAAGVILLGGGLILAWPLVWATDYRGLNIPLSASELLIRYLGIILICFLLSLKPKR